MSAPEVFRGTAAFLVAAQGLRLHKTEQGEIYHLRTAGDCRIAVWDQSSRSLAVFDTATLFALANAAAVPGRAIDPPSRL